MIKYSDKYMEFFDERFLMGPNSIRLLDELLVRCPIHMSRENTILDLGCGKGLTSMFLANEVGATVYANDLWVKAEDNLKRFEEWNIQDFVIPSCEDANNLSFETETFDAIFTVDAYHYFAGKEGFFQEKILPFVKKGGTVLIAIPGVKEELEGQQEERLKEWLGEEANLFHSCNWWKKIIGESDEMESIDVWEMENFTLAWESWLGVNNKFAIGDKAHYDSIIKKYTCFVGIVIKKR